MIASVNFAVTKMNAADQNQKTDGYIFEVIMDKINFKPCPFCGSTDIGVKDNIVDVIAGHDEPAACRRKIWAYCRYCEATSGHTIRDIVYDEEEILVGMELWNKRAYEEK